MVPAAGSITKTYNISTYKLPQINLFFKPHAVQEIIHIANQYSSRFGDV